MKDKNTFEKMKEACEICSEAFKNLSTELEKLSKNKRYSPNGSLYHK